MMDDMEVGRVRGELSSFHSEFINGNHLLYTILLNFTISPNE